MIRERKVTICKRCSGEGILGKNAVIHKDANIGDVCGDCYGSGRLMKLQYQLRIPFTEDLADIKIADKEIQNLLFYLNTKENIKHKKKNLED